MKRFFAVLGLFSIIAGSANAAQQQRAAQSAASSTRGYAGLADAYRTNQRNTYYMVAQPDVDTACRAKIYKCLADYCGDITVVPGQRESRCTYSTEGELYNYTLLCLQKDTETLLPQYSTSYATSAKGMNTAGRLCMSYVQQELMAYLSMANMSDQLTKQRSSVCVQRRQELEAAMSCHSVALGYGNETDNMLKTQLTDFCGAGVPGGSAEMVQKFASAGNVGANIWGWAEKMVNLDMNKKGADWQNAVDSVLAGYANRMNLACGENLQINTVQHNTANNGQPTGLQTAAALAIGMAYPKNYGEPDNPYEATPVYQEVYSMSEVYDYPTAKQVVNAGLTNAPTTQNAFLSTAQMGSMQSAYTVGTKVFILRDSARCFIVPVQTLTAKEQAVLSQTFASCINK